MDTAGIEWTFADGFASIGPMLTRDKSCVARQTHRMAGRSPCTARDWGVADDTFKFLSNNISGQCSGVLVNQLNIVCIRLFYWGLTPQQQLELYRGGDYHDETSVGGSMVEETGVPGAK